MIQMIDRQMNCPLTSSTGRLFDAVSALLMICRTITYDSQAAMALEAAADPEQENQTAYSFEIRPDQNPGQNPGQDPGQDPAPAQHPEMDSTLPPCLIMDIAPCVQQMVADIKDGVSTGLISARFHLTLSVMMVAAADQVRQQTGLDRVVLSGGVFNNDTIFSLITRLLETKGFKVYTHTIVPCGDAGIALGQVMAAAALEKTRPGQFTQNKSDKGSP